MKFMHFAVVFLASIVASTLLVGVALHATNTPEGDPQQVYIGIYAGSTNIEELKSLADEVKTYTNIFVVGSFAITWNLTSLKEISQHLNDKGLNFMIFEHPNDTVPFAAWLSEAKQNWSNHFMGLYAYDEPGGYQVDMTNRMAVKEADNYTDAANKYVITVADWLNQLRDFSGCNLPMYASDYVFYEYDYKAGYDAVFAQFGWNFSRPLHVALCRGAATMNDKAWGAIITYEKTQPPYYESGQKMYEDMVYAYQNGAKYILLFDYDKNTTCTALQPEHLEALKQFWQYVKENPRKASSPQAGSLTFCHRITASASEDQTTASGDSGKRTISQPKSGTTQTP